MISTIQAQGELRAKINEAARIFFRGEEHKLTREQRDLLTTSDAAGGSFISQTFTDALTIAQKYYGPVASLVHTKRSDNGEPTKFVTTDPTGQNFSLLTQGSTSAAGIAQQPTMTANITSVDTIVGSYIYSVQMVDDSAFDLQEWLSKTAFVGVARALETAITLATTNDGTSTALPSSPSGGLIGAVSSGFTQTSGTLSAGITQSQLLNLSASVDRAYFETGAYMASPSVEAALRAQTDSTDKLLYPIDDATGLLRIGGKLLYPNSAMAANLTASSPLVIFGDLSKFYSVLNTPIRVKVISMDGNPNLAYNLREMIIYTRLGATTGVSTAVKSLVSAAS
jgi:HK97 family phage major capsid protein